MGDVRMPKKAPPTAARKPRADATRNRERILEVARRCQMPPSRFAVFTWALVRSIERVIAGVEGSVPITDSPPLRI